MLIISSHSDAAHTLKAELSMSFMFASLNIKLEIMVQMEILSQEKDFRIWSEPCGLKEMTYQLFKTSLWLALRPGLRP